jgi:hypothetical protein
MQNARQATAKVMETRSILDFFVQAFAGAEVAECCPQTREQAVFARRASAAVDPTPDEIRAATAEIQSTWSDRERIVRAGRLGAAARWRVPCVRVAGLAADEECS